MEAVLLVGVGGFVGANARFILFNLFAQRFGTKFPYGVFFINVTGSFILGLFTALATKNILGGDALHLLVAVGFCGGYTTFSTYTYDTLVLLRERKYSLSLLANLLGSYVCGLVAALLGIWLGNAF